MKTLKHYMNKIVGNEKWMKLIRYLVIGILTTVVSFLTFWLLCYLMGIEPNLANMLSIACAVLFAYITNKKVVFKSKKDNLKELTKEAISFVLSRGLTILLEIGGMFMMVTLLSMEAMLSKVLISILVTILNYVISQFWVFKEVT